MLLTGNWFTAAVMRLNMAFSAAGIYVVDHVTPTGPARLAVHHVAAHPSHRSPAIDTLPAITSKAVPTQLLQIGTRQPYTSQLANLNHAKIIPNFRLTMQVNERRLPNKRGKSDDRVIHRGLSAQRKRGMGSQD
jgi:hypothetical protein